MDVDTFAPPFPESELLFMRAWLFVVPLVLALGAGCVRNPATGKRQLSLVSQKNEIQIGQQGAQEIVEALGTYPDPQLEAYVSSVGMRLAKSSERPDLPWSFRVLDDPTVNAFALPGGPIFITRGLLTHMNSEAELAAVLGHEVAHTTAKHAVSMISKQQLAQLGLGIGSILSPAIAKFGQLAGAGMGLLFLRFGRDAERQADDFGFKYMLHQGYDVRAMSSMFKTLERASGKEEAQRVPGWLATHPATEDRYKKNEQRIAEAKIDPTKLRDDRQAYLTKLSGTTYGADPRQGYFEGNSFIHPALKFLVVMPNGWKRQNLPQAVVAISPNQDAIIELRPIGAMKPDDAARRFFSIPGVQPASAQAGTLQGLPTVAGYFAAQTEQEQIEGMYAFTELDGKTYQVLGYSVPGRLRAHDTTIRATVSSFQRLTDPKALAVQPAKIELVTLSKAMTFAEFLAAYPSTVPAEDVATLNGVEGGAKLEQGRVMKRVVGGTPAKDAVASK